MSPRGLGTVFPILTSICLEEAFVESNRKTKEEMNVKGLIGWFFGKLLAVGAEY